MNRPPTTDAHEIRQRSVAVERLLHPDRRGEHRLAEHDDREQAVPLGDVPRVPRRAFGRLRPHRHERLEQGEHDEARDEQGLGNGEPRDPSDLDEREPDGVAQCGRAALPVPTMTRAAIAPRVRSASRRSRGPRSPKSWSRERARNPGREDQHAGHLDEHREPVERIVGVVGRREPREVHPRPPDRRRTPGGSDEHVLARVAVDQPVVQARSRPARSRPRRSGRRTAPGAWRRGAPRRDRGRSRNIRLSLRSRRRGGDAGTAVARGMAVPARDLRTSSLALGGIELRPEWCSRRSGAARRG